MGVQVKAKQEADALRKDNDGLRLEITKLERQAAELQSELASAKVPYLPSRFLPQNTCRERPGLDCTGVCL